MAGQGVRVIALLMLLGAGVGTGLLLLVWALRPAEQESRRRSPSHHGRLDDVRPRLAAAAVVGVLAGLLTRWPAAVAAGLAFGFFARDLLSAGTQRTAATVRTSAIASWTEMLRDTMAAASGLEQAIITTAPLAPEPIRPEVCALVTRLQRERLGAALTAFGDDLADPAADLVVVALTLAAGGEASELGDLLTSLAAAARDTASMRLKVDATRARTRTSVRIISAVTIVMALVLVLLNRGYLTPFDSVTGQVVLLGVFACFGAALVWLASMSRFVAPERFLAAAGARHDDQAPSWH